MEVTPQSGDTARVCVRDQTRSDNKITLPISSSPPFALQSFAVRDCANSTHPSGKPVSTSTIARSLRPCSSTHRPGVGFTALSLVPPRSCPVATTAFNPSTKTCCGSTVEPIPAGVKVWWETPRFAHDRSLGQKAPSTVVKPRTGGKASPNGCVGSKIRHSYAYCLEAPEFFAVCSSSHCLRKHDRVAGVTRTMTAENGEDVAANRRPKCPTGRRNSSFLGTGGVVLELWRRSHG